MNTCTFSAHLTPRRSDMTTIERICPFETVHYNCSFNTVNGSLELTWRVIFRNQAPTTILYDEDSNVNDIQSFTSKHVRSSLTRYAQNQYIESVLMLEVTENVQHVVECTINDLPTVKAFLPVYQGTVSYLFVVLHTYSHYYHS